MGWEFVQLSGDRPESALFICRDESGRDLGYLFIDQRRWPPGQGSMTNYAEITRLNVTEAHQNKGIGGELVRMAMAWAKEHGYERVSVEASASSAQALGFYGSVGFRRSSVTLDREA